MSTTTPATNHRLAMAFRRGEAVTSLELFFDLVFVLAITQCTALMAHDPTWRGIGRGLVVLGLLWWAWVGYAWLTSVVDPDDFGVRLVLFAAMAALIVTSLCVPDAFGDNGLLFAIAYTAVRAAHVGLFVLLSRNDPAFRHSVAGFAISTSIAGSMLVAGSLLDGAAQLAVWTAALVLDMGGPLIIDTSGWRLAPAHFAERHGLIIIVALGESIVAIGVGAEAGVDGGVITAAVLGMALACAVWWVYFDAVSLAAARRLAEFDGDHVSARNAFARNLYSYLHLPMVAAIVLIALGIEHTLAHVGDPLRWEVATALAGGSALYLLSHVVCKVMVLGAFSVQRFVAAVALVALIPIAHEVDAVATVGLAAAVLWALIAYERLRYGDVHRQFQEGSPG